MRKPARTWLMLLTVLCLLWVAGCGSGSTGGTGSTENTPTTEGVSAAEAGVIKGIIYVDSGTSGLSTKTKSVSMNDIAISVISRPDLSDNTDEGGNFEIKSVPAGVWCIHASFESDGRDHEFGLCLEVTAAAGADVGSRVAMEESSLSCSRDDDCSTLYNLPLETCTDTLDLDSCSFIGGVCSGYTCSASLCTFGDGGGSSDDGEGGSSDSGGESSDDEDGPGGIGGVCSGSSSSCTDPDDFIYARKGPSGLCEGTSICTVDADCPADAFCYLDGYCIRESGFVDYVSPLYPGCESTSDCDDDLMCFPVNFGGSHCGNYCYYEIPDECETDADCEEAGENYVCSDIGMSSYRCIESSALACE